MNNSDQFSPIKSEDFFAIISFIGGDNFQVQDNRIIGLRLENNGGVIYFPGTRPGASDSYWINYLTGEVSFDGNIFIKFNLDHVRYCIRRANISKLNVHAFRLGVIYLERHEIRRMLEYRDAFANKLFLENAKSEISYETLSEMLNDEFVQNNCPDIVKTIIERLASDTVRDFGLGSHSFLALAKYKQFNQDEKFRKEICERIVDQAIKIANDSILEQALKNKKE